MKKIYVKLFLLTFILHSCSSENSSNNTENENGFKINNAFYSTSYVYLYDENTIDNNSSDLSIILSNQNLLGSDIASGINYVYIDFNGVSFEIGNKSIIDYKILQNASLTDGIVENGVTLLDDTSDSGFTAIQSSLNIISLSSTNIEFEFSFTREDGEIISGNYNGPFTDISD